MYRVYRSTLRTKSKLAFKSRDPVKARAKFDQYVESIYHFKGGCELIGPAGKMLICAWWSGDYHECATQLRHCVTNPGYWDVHKH